MTLWIPASAREPEALFVCRIPRGGGICGEKFATARSLDAHLRLCTSRHEQEVHTSSLKARMPIFDEESWDPEVAAHMREVGRRMKAEGRLTVKPSERAGFS